MMGRRNAIPMMLAILAIVFPTMESHPRTLTDAEQREICSEGESRYREIYKRAAKDEPFVVVLMFKDIFCPQGLSVKQGTIVRWVNVDKRTSHSVWFKQLGMPESDRVFPEEFVERTIDLPPGDYPYLCGPHWEEGMIGRLTVTGR
jgi:plastocyanin